MWLTTGDVPPELAARVRVPRAAEHTLHRQRLIDALHRNLDVGVQVISAPAGYGKTTLLADFCADLDIPVCWYSIGELDADAEWFAQGLAASMRVRFPEFGRSIRAHLAATERRASSAVQLAEALVRDMRDGIPDYFLLVLDDYHLVEGASAVNELLEKLIAGMPENCHVIVSSRAAVRIASIGTRLVRGRARAFTTVDLAFSVDEIRDLMVRETGAALSDLELQNLARETEGWIVGLLLYLQRSRSDGRPDRLPSPSREDVFSYLAAEVFDRLPAELRSFLANSSVLDPIDPEVCDRLLGIRASQDLLEDIERRSLFISGVQTPKSSYRYHPLFREFLARKLAALGTAQVNRLHRRAAAIFTRDHRWQDAIEHLIVARDYAKAAQVIQDVGEDLLNSGQWMSVSRWIDALPGRYRLSQTGLLLLEAQCDIHTGRLDQAARALTPVITKATQPDQWLTRARALSLRSAAHRLAGNLAGARKDIIESISLLDRNHGPPVILGDARRRLGLIYLEQGKLATAIKHLKQSLKQCSSEFDVNQNAAIHNSLGIAYRELGDLVQASVHLDLARQGWQKAGNTGALASLLNNLGLVYQCQSDYDRALKTFREGLRCARETGYRRMEACLLISIGDALRDISFYDEALASYQEGLRVAEEIMELYYVMCATAGIGETRRLLGEREEAEALLTQAVGLAESHGRAYEAALFSVRLGIIDYERGEYEKALGVLGSVSARLRKIGDREALARTSFHLAQASFLARDYGRARASLAESARLAEELGYDGFFTIEGRNAPLLLQYAVHEGLGSGQFRRALEGVTRRDVAILPSAPVIKRNLPVTTRPTIEVYAFGDGRVIVNSRRVRDSEWRSSRAREMFFYLMCSEVSQTKEQIAVALWPDLSPAKSTSNFHISLYRARHALLPSIVALDDGRYRIPSDLGIRFDVAEFLDATHRVTDPSLDAEPRLAFLRKASELYTGPFLPDVYSEWAQSRRRDLENRYLTALRMLAKSCGEIGDHDKALRLLQKIADIDPYDQDLYDEVKQWRLSDSSKAVLLREFRRYVDRPRAGD